MKSFPWLGFEDILWRALAVLMVGFVGLLFILIALIAVTIYLALTSPTVCVK